MTETQLKLRVLRMIKQDFPRAFVYKAADKFTSGIPDLLICLDGLFVGIELKTLTGKTSKIQDYTIRKIAEAGGKTAVARSVDEVREYLKLWQNDDEAMEGR